jgi:AcrR family transcriptional regulator
MMIVIVKGKGVAKDVKQRMIETAALALARKGLQGTSFSEVLAASGAPRGSLYHHFPGGKDELVLDAIDAAAGFLLGALGERRGRPAADIAEAFVAIWRFVLLRSEFAAGCAIAAVTVASQRPDQLERAAASFRAWRARLAELLAAGGVEAERAESLAALLLATCEGAVVLARADRSFDAFDRATGEAVALVRAAVR